MKKIDSMQSYKRKTFVYIKYLLLIAANGLLELKAA